MSALKERPEAGETVMTCGHVESSMHWFQYDKPVGFQRPDGTRGTSSWFVACDTCFARHGKSVMNYVRGDATWIDNAIVKEEFS